MFYHLLISHLIFDYGKALTPSMIRDKSRDHVRLFNDVYNQGPVLRKNFMLISHYRDQTIDDILK